MWYMNISVGGGRPPAADGGERGDVCRVAAAPAGLGVSLLPRRRVRPRPGDGDRDARAHHQQRVGAFPKHVARRRRLVAGACESGRCYCVRDTAVTV